MRRVPDGRTVSSPVPRARPGWALLAALGLAWLWCLGLLFVRWWLTGHMRYTFLVWNLFLAAVPLGVACWLSYVRQRMVGLGLLGGWLLFFPNAPYVFTDFIHLSPYGRAPLWFDVLLLASFALTALWLGLVSLHLVHEWIERHVSPLAGWAVVLLACPLAGFGVYLGRFGRWNSWDLLHRPVALLADVVAQLSTPEDALRIGAVTFGFGGLLVVAYLIWWAHGAWQRWPASSAPPLQEGRSALAGSGGGHRKRR